MYNLIENNLIPINRNGVRENVSLPEFLFYMEKGDIDGPIEYQVHQEIGLYTFFVLLASYTLHKIERDSFLNTVDEWKQALLSCGDLELWDLFQKDVSKPAFLQCPIKPSMMEEGRDISYPDELTSLKSNSKNHVLKKGKIRNFLPWHWICHLIEIQMMSSGNSHLYRGISRIENDFSARYLFTYCTGHTFSERWKRDVLVSLKRRHETFNICPLLKKENGIGFVWSVLWDGNSQIDLTELDPFYIEICRIIRLINNSDLISAKIIPSKVTRIVSNKGITGDLFTPIDIKNERLIRISETGVGYKDLYRILFSSECKPSLLMVPDNEIDKGNGYVLIQTVLSGKGKTYGYHEIAVNIPLKMKSLLFNRDNKDIGIVSKTMLNDLSVLSEKVLFFSLLNFIQEGKDDFYMDDIEGKRKVRKYDQKINSLFDKSFLLWMTDIYQEEKTRKDWINYIYETGYSFFMKTVESMKYQSRDYYKSVVEAECVFKYMFKKHIKE